MRRGKRGLGKRIRWEKEEVGWGEGGRKRKRRITMAVAVAWAALYLGVCRKSISWVFLRYSALRLTSLNCVNR